MELIASFHLLHDLPMAKYEAGRFVEILTGSPSFEYPVSQRIKVNGDKVFFDS